MGGRFAAPWANMHLFRRTMSFLVSKVSESGRWPRRQVSYILFPMSFWISSIVSFSPLATAWPEHKLDVMIELDPMSLSYNSPCLLETRRWSCLSWSGRSRRQWWWRQTLPLSASSWAWPVPQWIYLPLYCWTRNAQQWKNTGTGKEMLGSYFVVCHHNIHTPNWSVVRVWLGSLTLSKSKSKFP